MLQKIARLGSRFCEQQKGVLKGPGALFPLRVRQSAYGFFSTAVGPIANAGGVARLLRWGHGEPLSESWVAFLCLGVRKRAYSASGVASRGCWPATEQATHYINSIYPWGPKVVPSVHYLMPLSRLISCYQKIAILGSRFCEQQQGPLKGLVAVAYFPCRYLPTVRFLQVLNFARIGAGVRTRPSNVRC